MELRQIRAAEAPGSNRSDGITELALQDESRRAGSSRRRGRVPSQTDLGPAHVDDVAAPEVDAVFNPTRVRCHDLGAACLRQSGQDRFQVIGIFRDLENQSAGGVLPVCLTKRFVGAEDAETLAKRSRQEPARRCRSPGHEVGNARVLPIQRARSNHPAVGRFEIASHGFRTRNARDVEHERQRPGGDIVDLIRKPLAAPALLFLQKILFHLNVRVQERTNQALGRLGERYDVGSRGILFAAGVEFARGALNLDALIDQKPDHLRYRRAIAPVRHDVSPDVLGAPFFDGCSAVLIEVVPQLPRVCGCGFGGGEGGDEVMAHGISKMQLLSIGAAIEKSAGGGLLVSHGDRAVI